VRLRSRLLALAAAALAAACANAGEDRLLSIRATGIVMGEVYFDLNGNDTRDPSDSGIVGVRIVLLVRGTSDTAATATTTTGGSYRMDGIPVGSYNVTLATGFLADTAVLVTSPVSDVTVQPNDSVTFVVGVTYPRVSVAEALTWTLNRRVFVEGLAVNRRVFTYSDTTVSLVSNARYIRLGKIFFVSALDGPAEGESLRVRGTTSMSRLGQRSLEEVTAVFGGGIKFLPAAFSLTTQEAATADLGQKDAALAQVSGAGVSDTATVAGDFRLTVDDGSGPLEVLLDRAALPPFLPAQGPVPYVPGDTLDIVGILAPTGTGTGVWRLKPRKTDDIVKR
jgi:hypothetical protein